MNKDHLLELYYSIRNECKEKGIQVSFGENYLNRIIHAKDISLKAYEAELEDLKDKVNHSSDITKIQL